MFGQRTKNVHIIIYQHPWKLYLSFINTPRNSYYVSYQNDIHISESAMGSAGVILDASKGHIIIDDNALHYVIIYYVC